MLSGCAGIDAQQTQICEALIPVLEASDVRISITRVLSEGETGKAVTVIYRTSRNGTLERPRRTEIHHLVCKFAGSGFEDAKLILTSVEADRLTLSETQLHFLNARWIKDAEAQGIAQQLLSREGDARPKGFAVVDAETGYFLQQIVNAGPPTALYALLALAYSLVYGLTNRINLAFGEIATIGAYGALLGVLLATAFGVPQVAVALPLAVLVAVALSCGSGIVIGRQVFLPLLGRSSQPLLVATIGLATALQEFLARTQGVRERWLQPIFADPHQLVDGPFDVAVTSMQLLVTLGAATMVAVMIAVVNHTHFGRLWRAVADDRTMACMLGVNVDRVVVVSFAIAAGLAGLGGSILTLHYGGTSFAMGTVIGLKALVAAVVGGIGSLPGAALGGLVLGLIEAMWSAYEPIVWRDGVVFSLMIVFLILRPQGLLGTRRALEERDERP